MVTPQFRKKEIIFLGLGTLLPAYFLWWTLLDTPVPTNQTTKPLTLSAQVNQAIAASSQSVLGVISGIKPSASQVTVDSLVDNKTVRYTVTTTPATQIVDRPTGQGEPTTRYKFNDLTKGDFVVVVGKGQGTSVTASVIEIDPSSLPIPSGQKTIYLPAATTSSEPVMPASEMVQQSKGGK